MSAFEASDEQIALALAAFAANAVLEVAKVLARAGVASGAEVKKIADLADGTASLIGGTHGAQLEARGDELRQTLPELVSGMRSDFVRTRA